MFQLKLQLDREFDESEANLSVISSSHCSDASEDGKINLVEIYLSLTNKTLCVNILLRVEH